jgi:undecaprenyl-phosphate alpha-N-acetylglucosaminyl 1-phosphatetransferase
MGNFSGNLIALLATSSLIYFLSTRAHLFGLIDRPSHRKVHETEIPTVGGIAIFGGFLLALLSSQLTDVYLVGFVIPALLLVGVGAIDDAITMSHKPRFVLQIMAGLLMTVGGGVVIEQLGALLMPGHVITLGVLAIPFTLICTVGLVNAFNMSDGIDGLAGALTLVALLGLGTVAYIGGQAHMVEGLSFLGFSLLAFLGFNARFLRRERAHIFLGDCGSTLLGFAVLWFAISLTQGDQAVMTPVTPLWFVAVPFFDMATVMMRRVLRQQSPFEADREHLHHIFLAAGFTVTQTVLMMTALALVLAVAGIAGLYLGVPEHVMFAAYGGAFAGYFFLVALTWRRMRFLGRELCRRARQERRTGDRRRHPGTTDTKPYEGANRRGGEERRLPAHVRRSTDQAGDTVYTLGLPQAESGHRAAVPQTIFVNRYFWPDHSSTSQLLTDLAFALAGHGQQVSVITSRQRYSEPQARLPAAELERGVSIHRVWTSHFGRHGLPGRAFDYLTFYLSAAWRLWRTTAPGDTVVALTDPPLISTVASVIVFLRRARLVIWHQDLFPEVATAVGLKVMQGRLARALVTLRNHSVRHATMNVVLCRNMAKRLIDSGCPAEKVRIIHNWCNGQVIYPTDAGQNPLRREWDLQGRFVVGYSGNMGRVHEFNTLIEAAEQLRDDPDIVFLYIGDGYYRRWIEDEASRRGLTNIEFRPYQPRERLIESLGLPDVHLISLRTEMDGLVFPSKLYGILAAGRPPLFIGSGQGDAAQILRAERAGLVVGEGDAQGVVAAIRQLQGDAARRAVLGKRARKLFERHYSMETALLNWCHILSPLSAASEACRDFETQREWVDTRQEA